MGDKARIREVREEGIWEKAGHTGVVEILFKRKVVGRFCGAAWCEGACGFPRASIEHNGSRFRLRDSATAAGPVFQRTWPKWGGKIVELNSLLSEKQIEHLLERWWL